MKIVADAHIPYVTTFFKEAGDLVLKPGRAIEPSDLKDATILLVRSVTAVNESLLGESRVKFVGSVTAGADHLDTRWLAQAGIPWQIAAGFNAPPVADYIVSVVAALQRQQMLTTTPCRAAVIGVGHVGRLVVGKLKLLGFEVVQCDPFRMRDEKDFKSIPVPSLCDLDVITLHVPLTFTDEPTFHLIDAKFLARQKKDCILINTSRGAVVDTQALLTAGRHLHGCLDVWENEPDIDENTLAQATIATPHIAGYSKQSKIRGIEIIYQSACKKGLIPSTGLPQIETPHQHLRFSGGQHHWQDVVLGIFNPLILTAMMKTSLLETKDRGAAFDEMRHQFNYRYEFAYTSVECGAKPGDKEILKALGITLT